MKRKSKFTFFELKVTFFFDLFDFWIGGYYDYKNKALFLALIPTLVIRLENAKPKVIKDAIAFMESKLPKEAIDIANKESRAIIKKIKKGKK